MQAEVPVPLRPVTGLSPAALVGRYSHDYLRCDIATPLWELRYLRTRVP